MALTIAIGENNKPIHGYSAQRLGDKKTRWNKYLIKRHTINMLDIRSTTGGEKIEIIGIIRHKYEDGADVLTYKVMKYVTGRKS
jgi:hypothetical protein